ncbi:MAG TPA: hypothetical protein DCR43_05405 [Bacteroidales bacterium]|nr:MAG: hypothetical protein A2X11_03970 [Bacteroidetes bacterium GWE2_42_24]OFY26084.1 MAG: hypothetical protein A2X09_11535 [Bacteroidetes bacterium GWF2_43_11]HAQ65272.1 hypothetical protein [Bacteroidales bacterium]HBZ65395.1 hypothetical protein [Bacteroidales bacterium]
MRFKLKYFSLALIAGLSLNSQMVRAQESNVYRPLAITTAVPFMLIAPDARGGSMGETGVATDPDVNSMHWNPAKYAFIDKQMGFSVSYSPWLKELVDDIGLGYLTGYYKLDKRQTIAGSLRYFSLGEIQFTDASGADKGIYKPNEFTIQGTYSRLFTDHLSGAVSAKFIYSNLTQGQSVGSGNVETHAGTSVAADVSIYYRKPIDFSSGQSGQFALGVNIANIGSKISYTSDIEKDFIPTQLRIGPAFTYNIDNFNTITGTVEFTKLLVPTPPIYDTGVDVNNETPILRGMNDNVSVFQGMLQSFYDAPDGFSEELKEITWAVGVEYWYNKQFAIRGGYHHESADKGDRKFFTFGAGLRYNVFGLDFSYLVSTDQRNPLDNTLRFSLTFDMDAFKAQESK